jgi:DNA-binding GntR family transcriptional regulator
MLSQAEHAYQSIADRLVTLQIHPGAPINDEQLAQDLEMGRTPVREALKRLESERLVVSYPRRGTFASEVHITDLGHISEVRQQLEPLAAGLAAARATARHRNELSELAAELEFLGEPHPPMPAQAMVRLDMRLHRAVYAATDNPYLADTLIRYDNLATRIWCLFLDRLPGLAGHVAEHSALVDCILAGDAEQASVHAAAHVSGFEAAVRAII